MSGLTRRAFLLLTGGASAAASLEPGRKFVNKLIPYVNQPEKIIPGDITWFATTCRECPAGCGMLAAHRDGRITKAEGNPDHPVNRGGLCVRGQSSLQGVYDPDRLKKPLQLSSGRHLSACWDDALSGLASRLRERKGKLLVISQPETGSLQELLSQFAAAFGGNVVYHDRLSPSPLLRAHESVYSSRFIPRFDLAGCDHLVTFGADFLETWVSPIRFADEFAAARSRSERPLRHVFIGPRLSMTAGNADRFIAVRPEDRPAIAGAVLAAMIKKRKAPRPLPPEIEERIHGYKVPDYLPDDIADAVATELLAARRPLVLPGPALPDTRNETELAVLVALLNDTLGNRCSDLTRSEQSWNVTDTQRILEHLTGLSARDTVLILNTNIVFTLPAAAELLRQPGLVAYAGTLPDETASVAHIVFPLDYQFETWGDHDPVTGVHSLQQPVMNRLYDTRPAGDLLLQIAHRAGNTLKRQDNNPATFEEWLKYRWHDLYASAGVTASFDSFWTDALSRGFITGHETLPLPEPQLKGTDRLLQSSGRRPEITLFPFTSVTLYDGRTANRGWIQETPDPVTTAVWGSWAEIHPRTAEKLGVKDDDLLEVSMKGKAVHLPVIVTDSIQEGTAGCLVGQGHTAKTLTTAGGVGSNLFVFAGESFEISFRKAGRSGDLVRASGTDRQHGRKILQWLSANVLHRLKPGDGDRVKLPLKESYEPNKDTWAGHDHNGHRWGMVIDLNRCNGCQACTIACYAENNVAVVGRKQVSVGRELAWLKVTPYRDEQGKKLGWLPILCQHCDAAPCEPVCPVYAAVHNEEGLNAQVYNRCIGTRYCANNCPYKVRRFNWFEPKWRYPLDLQLNPDVTVRSRGVMEKCTFCVQRIRSVELKAAREGRPVRDGEVQTACAQSCPAKAIIFGDLMDPDSQVLKLMKQDPRRYQLLEKLNTKTAVVYLKRVVHDQLAKD